jgi:hypothetical protein
MRKSAKETCFALAMLAAAAPASAGTTIATPGEDRAVFVIGVGPSRAEVSVSKGSVVDGVFHHATWTSLTFVDTPQDGYIIAEAPAGSTQAIVEVTMKPEVFMESQRRLIPCNGSLTMVFDAPAGKVIYLASIFYRTVSEGIRPLYRQDIEGARTFLKAHYPQLADKLESGHYDLKPAQTGACVKSETREPVNAAGGFH